ncbi:hypothetical protein [Spirosoma agri]|uniref:Uncharacterized protein n=1 Tax=Spirosoma agri TaxID=1987381 RepID=A0A6M0IFJ3_9BACT|nr:hypothetical protein [Spirosoma agri]NEU66592.1 hypothetical protein [Spirosoma agri]
MQPNLTYLLIEPPVWLAVAFVVITTLTLGGFLLAVHRSSPKLARPVLLGLLLWLTLLGVLASQDFFTTLNTVPTRLMLGLLPPLLFISGLFMSAGGRRFVDALPLATLTYLNSVRVFVELVLFGLYVHHQVPELMTFEGRNFDILAGLTAPIIAYFSFNRPTLSKRWLFIWNVMALLLLLNIVTNAILSAPLPFQQFSFEQPNVGILKFPFIWLPGFVVPVVLFGHFVSLRRLSQSRL